MPIALPPGRASAAPGRAADAPADLHLPDAGEGPAGAARARPNWNTRGSCREDRCRSSLEVRDRGFRVSLEGRDARIEIVEDRVSKIEERGAACWSVEVQGTGCTLTGRQPA
eukprot:1654792-Pyramimonas_sp.AAC.1